MNKSDIVLTDAKVEGLTLARKRASSKADWGEWFPVSASVYEACLARPTPRTEVRLSFVEVPTDCEDEDNIFHIRESKRP